MADVSNTSRNNNTGSLKDTIVELVKSELTEEEKGLLGDIKFKQARGFRNRILAGYLVPAMMVPDFKKDPEKYIPFFIF